MTETPEAHHRSSLLGRPRVRAACYAALGASVVAWWIALAVRPLSLHLFAPSGFPAGQFAFFAFPDVALATSAFVACACAWRRSALERFASWFLAGATVYPTLWCASVSLRTGEAVPGLLLMLGAAALALACAIAATRAGVHP